MSQNMYSILKSVNLLNCGENQQVVMFMGYMFSYPFVKFRKWIRFNMTYSPWIN